MGFELGWLSWLIVGLVAGAIAKLILPGKQAGGFWVTMLLGVVGAIVGGVIAGFVFGVEEAGFLNPLTWVFSIGGSLIVLVVWGAIATRRGGKAVEK